MEYIGMDFHKQYTIATRIRENGNRECCRLANTPASFAAYFAKSRSATSVVFESGKNWPMLYELVEQEADHITMAHPLKVKAIASARIKTDKIDSRILAELLSADLIPESHLRQESVRTELKVLRQRAFLTKQRTMTRNRIHVLLDEQPYEIRKSRPEEQRLWGKAGMSWLTHLQLPNSTQHELLQAMLRLEAYLRQEIETSNQLVNELFMNNADARLLETIPGFGKFGALLVSNEIDGVARFASPKKLAAYAGIVPSTYASGGKCYHGRITKTGSKWLRWLLLEAVQPAVRANSEIAAYYESHKQRLGTKKARVATARHLLTIAYYCLRDQREFLPVKPRHAVSPSYFASGTR